MRGVFFYTACVSFTGGIFLRSFFDIEFADIGFVAVLGVTFLCVSRIKVSDFDSGYFLVGLMLLWCALGMFRMHIAENDSSLLSIYQGKDVSLTGKIVREPEFRETNIHLFVQPVGASKLENELVLVTVDRFAYATKGLTYGDVVHVQGTLAQPEPFEADGGRIFDYPGYLQSRGVTFVISFGDVEVLTQESGTFFGYLFYGKQKFMSMLERIVPEPHVGLGEGILLGVRRAIGEDLEHTFRETGIIHIVVLSGYNIMIVVECCMFLLSYVFYPRTRMIIGIFIIILFALLVGLSASVIRASIMAGLLVVARNTGRLYIVLRALMVTCIIMLISNPYLLAHDPGFQLSFLATLGLILLSPIVERRLGRIPEIVGIRSIMTATIATQIFVLPLLLYHTGTLSLISIIVNILVLPMVPVAMALTFVAGTFGLFSNILGLCVGYLAYLSLGYIIFIAQAFGSIPFTSFQIEAFPFWVVVLVYGIMTVVLWQVLKNEKEVGSPIVVDEKTQEEVRRVVNDYEGWTIVEEKKEKKEIPRDQSSVARENTPFPFR